MSHFAWAIGDALLLAFLFYQWFSIRRELRRDAARREQEALAAAHASENDDTPVPGYSAAHSTRAERQQALHPGPREPRE